MCGSAPIRREAALLRWQGRPLVDDPGVSSYVMAAACSLWSHGLRMESKGVRAREAATAW